MVDDVGTRMRRSYRRFSRMLTKKVRVVGDWLYSLTFMGHAERQIRWS